MAETITNVLIAAFMVAILVSALLVRLKREHNPWIPDEIARVGVEVEAEVVGRFEAEAPQGSELAKARQLVIASWVPLEMELRYVFDGREIVSRGRVSSEIFFRTRGMQTLSIKVSPRQPERWAIMV